MALNWDAMREVMPWLITMVVLMVFSAFFSASEAALFYLRWQDRRALASGSRSQRIAAGLLEHPERLLFTVLFWNLMINVGYFAISSIVGLRLEESTNWGTSGSVAFAVGTLLAIIFFSEMLPKSLGVLSARSLATAFAIPLALFVRIVDPLFPILRTVNVLSQRLIWPRFRPEPYLEISDLERAIELSTSDAQLVEQEQAALRNIVLLSDIRVDEWMRPRAQFRSFRPPVSLSQLDGQMTPSGYLLVTESESEEIAAAIHLKDLSDVPQDHLEHHAEPVIFVPWCATVASALQQMHVRDREVVAVVNEFGETIGILTIDDILDTIFTYNPSRSGRLLDRTTVEEIREDTWHVTGRTSLRRLAHQFRLEVPPSKSVTVAGVIQESLERLAHEGDECDWGPFHFRVLEAPQRGQMLIEMTLRDSERKDVAE